MEILWEEEGFQFGFKRWQGCAVSKVLWEWIPNVGSKARESAEAMSLAFVLLDFPGTGDEMVLSIYTEIPSLELQNAEFENRFHDQRFPMERVKKLDTPSPNNKMATENNNKNIPKINKCIY